jgi:hypothetical protein
MINRAIEKHTVTTPVQCGRRKHPRGQGRPGPVPGLRRAIRARARRSHRLVEKDLNLLIHNVPDLQFRTTSTWPSKAVSSGHHEPPSTACFQAQGRYFNGVLNSKPPRKRRVQVTLDAWNQQPAGSRTHHGRCPQPEPRATYRTAQLDVLRQLETIEVDDGRVLVKPRVATP